jgi:hypothetical protein
LVPVEAPSPGRAVGPRPTAPVAAAGAAAPALEACVEAARRCSSPESAFLCASPVSGGDALLAAPSATPIAHWGWFNPMGPTLAALVLIDLAGGDEQLLCACALHPFSPSIVICGLLPASDEEARSRALGRLFAENGPPDHPLLGSLPTYVMLRPQSPVAPDELQRLFFAAAQRARPEDIDECCDLLKRFKGLPWEREAPERLFGAALAGADDRVDAEPPTWEQFDQWWDLVTDRAHVKAEVSQMGAAWEGAIRFVASDPSRHGGLRWQQASRLVQRLL